MTQAGRAGRHRLGPDRRADFYNRFSNLKLPEYLAFFGGRRFVPIAAGLAALAIAVVIGLRLRPASNGGSTASRAVVGSGEMGLFVYGC
jgi:PTS system N-acetylglucosamine-specific IIC component